MTLLSMRTVRSALISPPLLLGCAEQPARLPPSAELISAGCSRPRAVPSLLFRQGCSAPVASTAAHSWRRQHPSMHPLWGPQVLAAVPQAAGQPPHAQTAAGALSSR